MRLANWKSRTTVGLALLFGGAIGTAFGQEEGAAGPTPPEWFVQHNAFLTQGSGRWITDNAAYRSEDEPYDAYGLEWKSGLGGQTVTGRLFGLQNGREVGTFWEFRILWHPGEGQGHIMQYGGDGTLGTGTMEPRGEGKVWMVQDFYNPDGSRVRLAHESTHGPGAWVHDRSFMMSSDGEWLARRSYDWKLEPPDPEEAGI